VTTPEPNVEKIRRLWEAFENEGFAAAAALVDQAFADEVEFNPLTAGGAGGRTYRGRDGMMGFFGELAEAFADVGFEPVECHAVGDELVVAFTRMVGTAKETGLPLRQDLSLVYEFGGDQVQCVTAYESPAEALEAAQRGHADA
jgi:ketosteroid isomerase-like protein